MEAFDLHEDSPDEQATWDSQNQSSLVYRILDCNPKITKDRIEQIFDLVYGD